MNIKKTAVVLFQLGGPDSLEAVEPFFYNLFCDPDIIDLPGAFLFRKTLAKIISSRRAPKVRQLYKNIGGASPILPQTQMQAMSLQESLKRSGVIAGVYIAMRYWHPMTKETVEKIQKENVEEVVLLPLYPHYSKVTTGSSAHEWNNTVNNMSANHFSTKLIKSYYDHPMYIAALVENINRSLDRVPQDERKHVHLLFSAHGTPVKLVNDGDPYSNHIRITYERVIESGNFGLPHHLCFQSKVGPQRWLEPSLIQTIDSLAAQRVSHIIVVPIAFVTDHIETLSEIGIEGRDQAYRLGIKYFDVMPALIANEKFISCLTDLVIQQLKN
ncbi:MAG: ferrochelatase [Bacteroidota bacterium]